MGCSSQEQTKKSYCYSERLLVQISSKPLGMHIVMRM